jgi:large subunit ribosomal protein L13
MVLGRLASIVAKNLLEGNRVVVVNVDKVIVTGTSKKSILDKYFKRLRLRSNVNPRRHGPFVYRSPEGIFRRTVRGMLPRRKAKGREAFRRLKVYRGVPPNIKSDMIISIDEAKYREGPYPYMYLEEISRLIGWMPIEERLGRVGK